MRSRGSASVVAEYQRWLQSVPWQLFCTFTFGYQVSERQAEGIFREFLDRVERQQRAPVTLVRGTEHRYSGCGMPASPWHFHSVMTSCVCMNSNWLKTAWEDMAGTRRRGAGADIRQYDPALDGISYVLKFLSENHGDWDFRHLDLVMPGQPRNKREKRRQTRNAARVAASVYPAKGQTSERQILPDNIYEEEHGHGRVAEEAKNGRRTANLTVGCAVGDCGVNKLRH